MMRLLRPIYAILALSALLATSPGAVAPVRAEGEAPFDEGITTNELLSKARDAFGLENHKLAATFYEEVLRREPANVDALAELANVYERDGRIEDARSLLVRAVTLAPRDTRLAQRLAAVDRTISIVLRDEAAALIEHGQYEEAIPKLTMLIDLTPDDAALSFQKGQCLAKIGRNADALTQIDAAIALDPQPNYYELRNTVVAAMQDAETQDLRARAEELVAAGTPEAREEAIGILSDILAADPKNKWARHLYDDLTRSQPAVADSSRAAGAIRDAASRTGGWMKTAVARAIGFGDRHLGKLIALLIIFAVFRSPLAPALAGRLARTAGLSGRLSQFSLPEVFLLINGESQTGVLTVKGGSVSGKAWFQDGEPCHSVAGKLEGADALRALLRDSRAGQFAFTRGRKPRRRTIDTPLEIFLYDHNPQPLPPGPQMAKGKKQKSSKPEAESLTADIFGTPPESYEAESLSARNKPVAPSAPAPAKTPAPAESLGSPSDPGLPQSLGPLDDAPQSLRAEPEPPKVRPEAPKTQPAPRKPDPVASKEPPKPKPAPPAPKPAPAPTVDVGGSMDLDPPEPETEDDPFHVDTRPTEEAESLVPAKPEEAQDENKPESRIKKLLDKNKTSV